MISWSGLNKKIERCDRCPRLRRHCETIARQKRRAFLDWEYWGRPVPNFGDRRADLLIVGLAPAAHGANRTGRMFTGDRSGQWLFRALFRAGFANQADSETVKDGLLLTNCAITAVCHCAPPENRPTKAEQTNCREWFDMTVDLVNARVLLALGQLAWNASVDLARCREWIQGKRPRFGHGQLVKLKNNCWLLGSYHPSQQNTFTGRLTEPMLDRVFCTAKRLIETGEADEAE